VSKIVSIHSFRGGTGKSNINEETLLSIAISDLLLIILRPDQQDYLGTAVSAGIFCLRYPDHPVTQQMRRIAMRIAT
jgi:MinD-like ATPase involved in chromosome partitioning or flagellar assembly